MIQDDQLPHASSFDWLKLIRLTSSEGQIQVHCGAWTTTQAMEFVPTGYQLSPWTDRVFLVMSAALREKSIVLLRGDSDVASQLAGVCSIGLQKVYCDGPASLSDALRYLTGAQ